MNETALVISLSMVFSSYKSVINSSDRFMAAAHPSRRTNREGITLFYWVIILFMGSWRMVADLKRFLTKSMEFFSAKSVR